MNALFQVLAHIKIYTCVKLTLVPSNDGVSLGIMLHTWGSSEIALAKAYSGMRNLVRSFVSLPSPHVSALTCIDQFDKTDVSMYQLSEL